MKQLRWKDFSLVSKIVIEVGINVIYDLCVVLL